MKSVLRFIWHLPRNLLIFLISIYQKILSPDHSFWAKSIYQHGYCRFHPSCSEYGKQALKKYGFFKGFFKALYRVLRCNPWSDGGVDHP